jgi:hypothetical protein
MAIDGWQLPQSSANRVLVDCGSGVRALMRIAVERSRAVAADPAHRANNVEFWYFVEDQLSFTTLNPPRSAKPSTLNGSDAADRSLDVAENLGGTGAGRSADDRTCTAQQSRKGCAG